MSKKKLRPAVAVTCSNGHTFKVQSRPGSIIRCSVCWERDGKAIWVTVPQRDGGAR